MTLGEAGPRYSGAASSAPTEPDFEGGEKRGEWNESRDAAKIFLWLR
jgi:hypothetical protein